MTEIRKEVLQMIIDNNMIYNPTHEQLTYLKNKYGVSTTYIVNTFGYFKYSKQGQVRVLKALMA